MKKYILGWKEIKEMNGFHGQKKGYICVDINAIAMSCIPNDNRTVPATLSKR